MVLEPTMYTNVQNWAGDLISGNNTTGRILVVFGFCCSIAAVCTYVHGTKKNVQSMLDNVAHPLMYKNFRPH